MTFAAHTKRIRLTVLTSLAAAFVAFAGLEAPVHAQDATLVIGGHGGNPVDVDLSVLNDSGQQGRGQLLFPGSSTRPGQAIMLRPPGSKPVRLKRPHRHPKTKARRKAKSERRPHRHTKKAKRRIATRGAATMAVPAAPPKPPLKFAKPKIKSKPPANKKAPPKTAKRMVLPKPPPKPTLILAKPKPRPKSLAKKAPAKKTPAKEIPKRPESGLKNTVPSKTAMAPIPVPPKAERRRPPPTSLTGKAPKVSLPPPPMPPAVAAPRTPVASAPLKKKSKSAAKSPGTGGQVAAIPRTGSIAAGSSRRILFPPGSARLAADAQATLNRISTALQKNSALRLNLRAYARGSSQNASQARRLSLSRALAVRANLMRQGVRPTRIDVQALGNKVADGPPNRVDLLVSSR